MRFRHVRVASPARASRPGGRQGQQPDGDGGHQGQRDGHRDSLQDRVPRLPGRRGEDAEQAGRRRRAGQQRNPRPLPARIAAEPGRQQQRRDDQRDVDDRAHQVVSVVVPGLSHGGTGRLQHHVVAAQQPGRDGERAGPLDQARPEPGPANAGGLTGVTPGRTHRSLRPPARAPNPAGRRLAARRPDPPSARCSDPPNAIEQAPSATNPAIMMPGSRASGAARPLSWIATTECPVWRREATIQAPVNATGPAIPAAAPSLDDSAGAAPGRSCAGRSPPAWTAPPTARRLVRLRAAVTKACAWRTP